MLDDRELESAGAALRSIQAASSKHHTDLQSVLKRYGDLVEAYRLLKSDFEEEKESREKYKRLVKRNPQSPVLDQQSFVLLLIDGDHYTFKDNLIKARKEGGIDAAKRLKQAATSLPIFESQGRNCQLVVRVYANVKDLSRQLATAHLTGHDVRSINPFVAGFNSVDGLFDFVDAGDQREDVKAKIGSVFKFFVEDPRCAHVLFAGWNHGEHMAMLESELRHSAKVSLIRTGPADPVNASIGFTVEDMSSVLRFAGENHAAAAKDRPRLSAESVKAVQYALKPVDSNHRNGPTKPMCKYFMSGHCDFGSKCSFQHAKDTKSLTSLPERATISFVGKDISRLLPIESPATQGLIPLNKSGHRLDTALPSADKAILDLFRKRSAEHKLCNDHHLTQGCLNVTCEFDHSPIGDEIRLVLMGVARGIPCGRRGACRKAVCTKGHLCQKVGCHGGFGCKLGRELHGVDPVLVEWVVPETDGNAGGVVVGENDHVHASAGASRANSPESGVPLGAGASLDAVAMSSAGEQNVEWGTMHVTYPPWTLEV